MKDVSALMMRAISQELQQRIIPNLAAGGDAPDRAAYASQILELLAADTDILPEVATELAPVYRKVLTELLGSSTLKNLDAGAAWRGDLAAISPENGLAAQREIMALRKLGADILRTLSDLDPADPDIRSAIASLGQLDHEWLTTYQAARTATIETTESGDTDATPTSDESVQVPDVTEATVTTYLRERFPEESGIRATGVTSVPGGRSKKTWFIRIEGSSTLPSELVMRQDYQLHYEGTKVRDEFRPLAKLASLDLPVPTPLLLQEEPSILGQPFMFMEKASGSPPGSYFGLKEKCPGAFADVARLLAKLHSLPPADLGYETGSDPESSLIRLIESYKKKWRDNSSKPSPVIDYAFAWAEQVCRMDTGLVAPVHGDIGPHNMLVSDDRLQAMLDWEFAHAGDPAEDLGIARVYAEELMPWEDFMKIYRDAGGLDVPDRRIQMAMLLHFLKGACLVAVSGRNYEEGWTHEFIKGATAFAGLRQIELIIANQLKRFGAIE